ncbi:MAG: hypothetical protein K0R09_334 [Clostridiales bacterium]|nr:hypothetical protein [Clostridiales bacterium]
MIREFISEDIEQIYKIINMEVIDNVMDTIRNIQNDSKKFIVWDDAGIKGFAYMLEMNKENKEWNIQLFVEPKERRKRIGTALYQEIQRYLECEKPSVLVTEFRVDIDNTASFYEKLGYKKWYGSPELYYRGTNQPEVDIKFVPYEDKYYEQYAKCRQDCFYEMSVKNDFKPYVIPLSEQDKKNLFSGKDSIYVTLDNECLIGAITIDNGYLDQIMVSPAYQGKGYGKKITQFGINKELDKGISLIHLCYIEGNDKAENLYRSLGFETVQITHVYRKFYESR